MANGVISGPPAVSFYDMLSGLGDTIQKNQQQSAIASAFQPGADGKVDYAQALGTVAKYNPTLAVAMQSHIDQQAAQAATAAHQLSREKIEDDWADTTRADSLRAHQDSVAIQRAQLANTANKPFDISVSGPFGSTTKQTVFRGPDGSIRPFNLPATPDASGAPPQQPANIAAAPVAAAAPQSFADRFGASAPQSVAPSAAPDAQPASPANLDSVDPQTGRREDWLKSRPSNEQAYIKKIADYEIDPRTTSTKGGMRENVLSSVAQYDPTYNQNEFGTRAKAMRDFGTGALGNSVRSFDVATAHLDTLQKYVDALKSGDVRVLNNIRNAWLSETGSSLPTNVQAIAPIVGAEVSKAVIGSNNALADREELRKPLAIANSPEQISGAIQGYKELLTGQLRGLSKQFEDTTGKKSFNSRLSERTRNVLLGGDKTASDTSSGSQPNVTSTGVKWSIQ